MGEENGPRARTDAGDVIRRPVVQAPKELKTAKTRLTMARGHDVPEHLPPLNLGSGIAASTLPTIVPPEHQKQQSKATDPQGVGKQNPSALSVPAPGASHSQIAAKNFEFALAAPVESQPKTMEPFHARPHFEPIKPSIKQAEAGEPTDAQVWEQAAAAEFNSGSRGEHDLRPRATGVGQATIKEIPNSDSSVSQNRITIGQIEVRVNNRTDPVDNRSQHPPQNFSRSDFLAERYLDRFSIRP